MKDESDQKWTFEDTVEVIAGFAVIAVFVAVVILGLIFIATHAPSKVYLPWQPRI